MIDADDAQQALQVVAGVIRDSQRRVLLSQRRRGTSMAGRWEFPGGKVEPGETPTQALARELDEELGLAIEDAVPLISVPYRYPDKRIRLEVFEVRTRAGMARGREGQSLAWVELERLQCYPMPEADLPVLAALTLPERYLITPAWLSDPDLLISGIEQALAQGIRLLQLRLPLFDAERFAAAAALAQQRCVASGAGLLLNSGCAEAIDVADRLGCGVHLTAADLAQADKASAANGRLLAASCHTQRDVAQAAAVGCGFVVLGPIANTASHPGAEPLGWPRFADLRERTSLPIYALGGLGPDDLVVARGHGAQGIAAIRSLWPTSR